jgi:hypothetical protein
MRLKQYITEMTKPSINVIRDIIEKKLHWMYKNFQRKNWNIKDKDVVNILSKMFEDDKRLFVRFYIDNDKKRTSIGKYIHIAQIYEDGSMTVGLRKDVGKFFRRFTRDDKQEIFFDINRNAFIRELFDTFIHEKLHYRQQIASKVGLVATIGLENEDYFSDPFELEAFAQDAAVELLRYGQGGKIFNIYSTLFGTIDKDDINYRKYNKTWKIFLKKVMAFTKKIKL